MRDKFLDVLHTIVPQASWDSKINGMLMNSMRFVTLIVTIEDTFCLEFEDSALNPNYFLTIEDRYKYVLKKASGDYGES